MAITACNNPKFLVTKSIPVANTLKEKFLNGSKVLPILSCNSIKELLNLLVIATEELTASPTPDEVWAFNCCANFGKKSSAKTLPVESSWFMDWVVVP